MSKFRKSFLNHPTVLVEVATPCFISGGRLLEIVGLFCKARMNNKVLNIGEKIFFLCLLSFYLHHRLLLALSSPVFEAQFYGSFCTGDIIPVTDTDSNTFRLLLEYIYTSGHLNLDQVLSRNSTGFYILVVIPTILTGG